MRSLYWRLRDRSTWFARTTGTTGPRHASKADKRMPLRNICFISHCDCRGARNDRGGTTNRHVTGPRRVGRKSPWEALPRETPLLLSSRFCSVDASLARHCLQAQNRIAYRHKRLTGTKAGLYFSLPTPTILASELFGLKHTPTTGLKLAANRHVPSDCYRPHRPGEKTGTARQKAQKRFDAPGRILVLGSCSSRNDSFS